MSTPRKTDYQPSRPLNTLADVIQELQTVAVKTRNRLVFRGVFTSNTVYQMNPPPAAGDCWINQDVAGGTTRFYIQLTTNPRARVYWAVTPEAA